MEEMQSIGAEIARLEPMELWADIIRQVEAAHVTLANCHVRHKHEASRCPLDGPCARARQIVEEDRARREKAQRERSANDHSQNKAF